MPLLEKEALSAAFSGMEKPINLKSVANAVN
jgi:hypothetical protein